MYYTDVITAISRINDFVLFYIVRAYRYLYLEMSHAANKVRNSLYCSHTINSSVNYYPNLVYYKVYHINVYPYV